MEPEEKNIARLWDMLDSARAAVQFTDPIRYEDFLEDRRTRNAVERNLEIIGEAARRVTPETRERLPEIPWRSVIALRNILAHEYGEIRYEILWTICRSRLPSLIETLERMGIDPPPTEED